MQFKKALTRWKTFHTICMRSLINKLMLTQSCDSLRFSGNGILHFSQVTMDYDVCIYNRYGHRTNSCSGFCRRSETKPFGDRLEIVGYPQTVEIVPSPGDIRTGSLQLTQLSAARCKVATRCFAYHWQTHCMNMKKPGLQ